MGKFCLVGWWFVVVMVESDLLVYFFQFFSNVGVMCNVGLVVFIRNIGSIVNLFVVWCDYVWCIFYFD